MTETRILPKLSNYKQSTECEVHYSPFAILSTPVKVNVCSSFAVTDEQLRHEDVWDHKHL